ncbi:MAG: hypothetical protein PHH77_05755 [Victivallaceae bacterium]|nr:hypothetical protein [Victivallaceae bacterium]
MNLLLKKPVRGLKIFLVFAGALLGSYPAAAVQMPTDSFSTRSGTAITFQRFDREYYETLQYLKFADRIISGYLNSSAVKQSYPCRIFVLNEPVKGGINIVEAGGKINLYLHKDFQTAENKFAVTTGMINALLLAKTGFNPNECKRPLPPWLTVGIYGQMELRCFSHSILAVPCFPGLMALCVAGKLPDFRASLNTALSPEADGIAYRLYEELCRFVLVELKRLSSRADNPIADAVFMTARGKYSEEQIFDYTVVRAILKNYDRLSREINKKTVPSGAGDAQKVQNWFKMVANRDLVSLSSPLLTKDFVTRFYHFRRCTYVHRIKGSSPVRMVRDISKITEIYDRYGMSTGFSEMLDGKFRELEGLIQVSQPLCSVSLEKLRSTLQQFDQLPSVIIKKRLALILGELEQTFERQQQIEVYLRAVEYAATAPGKLYRDELIEDRRLEKNFCPAINNYLDQVEKSFLRD